MNKEEIQAQSTREEVKQEMLAHLQQKYGEDFVCQSIEYKSWAQPGYENMLAYPVEGDSDETFAVYRYDDGASYEDGYVGLLMKPRYLEFIELIIKRHFEENTITLNYNYAYPSSFDSDISFEEFLRYANKKNNITISIHVLVQEGFTEKSLNTIFEEVKDELEQTIEIGFLSISCYLETSYRADIEARVGQNLGSSSFPTKNRLLMRHASWGQIDFEYEYKERDGWLNQQKKNY